MKSFFCASLGIVIAVWLCFAQAGAAAESPDFERQILPLLYNRCFSCHSEKLTQPKADLRLDSAAGIRASGVLER